MKEKINEKLILGFLKIKNMITDKRAEGYVDSGVKILIAIVIGGLLLSLLYSLFTVDIMPTVSEKIETLFEYKK